VTQQAFFFYLYAAVVLAGALGLVLAKKLAHAIVSAFASMFAIAALFLLLGSEFLAAMQLFVYGGAITVLMLFALMLSGASSEEPESFSRRVVWAAVVVCSAFFAMLVFAIGSAHWPLSFGTQPDTAAIASILFSKYVVPFELAGLALTVALIGAIVLSRDEPAPAEKDGEPA
jgi:NADH-quinone oxidoreductase subunit J